jgi:hypothetical protein
MPTLPLCLQSSAGECAVACSLSDWMCSGTLNEAGNPPEDLGQQPQAINSGSGSDLPSLAVAPPQDSEPQILTIDDNSHAETVVRNAPRAVSVLQRLFAAFTCGSRQGKLSSQPQRPSPQGPSL